MPLDVALARSNFPALKDGFIFADNAGGSQCAKGVADSIYDYLLNTNVQLGADYSVAAVSTNLVLNVAPREAAKLFSTSNGDEVVFAASSTLNLENLSRGLEEDVQPGDEFIITEEHEANAGPWKKLAKRRGCEVRIWSPRVTNPENPYSVALDVEDLLPLITKKTRIIAFTAASNILGSIVPVKAVVEAARRTAKERGATKVEISVDCVAYAPHRLIDVKDWDVDYCVFSFYKVYGPHISVMYVRAAVLKDSVHSIAHHFLNVSTIAYKLQPGGPGYESVHATTAVIPYLLSLSPSGDLRETFDLIAQHEQTLIDPLLAFLTAPEQRSRGVRIVGSEKGGLSRVPTISFVVVGQNALRSKDVVKLFDSKGGIGIRFGHFYAYSLIDNLQPKLDTEDGVIRISLVHYNTVEEVNKIIEILKEALAV